MEERKEFDKYLSQTEQYEIGAYLVDLPESLRAGTHYVNNRRIDVNFDDSGNMLVRVSAQDIPHYQFCMRCRTVYELE